MLRVKRHEKEWLSIYVIVKRNTTGEELHVLYTNQKFGCYQSSPGRMVKESSADTFLKPSEYLQSVVRTWFCALSVTSCSVAELCPTLCNPMDCNMPGFPVLHHLLEFAQIYAHWVSDAIQLSHLLSSPSPPTFNLSQHQGLLQWVGSSNQVAKLLEPQFQHQSFSEYSG